MTAGTRYPGARGDAGRRCARLVVIVLYSACVVGANWLAEHVGAVSIGFGLHAAAAVYVVGPVLVLRDWVQRLAGLRASLLAVAAATAVAYLIASPAIATASAVSFAVSEASDAAVYTVIARRRGVAAAVLCSGMVGLAVDSVLFPAIAFGSLALAPGHLLGKSYGVLIGTALTPAARRWT